MANTKITDLTADTNPADGDLVVTVDVSDGTNKKVTRTNFFIDPPLGAGSVDPEDLVSGTGTSWAWQSWTPTLSGRFDDADWTKTAAYCQIGKTVFWRLKLVATAAAPMGGATTDARFSLPVTAASGYAGTDQTAGIGSGGIYDSGTTTFLAMVYLSSSSNSEARIRSGTSGATSITSTSPMTWTTSDEITVSGMYEAA